MPQCEFCNKEYKQDRSLKAHISKMHAFPAWFKEGVFVKILDGTCMGFILYIETLSPETIQWRVVGYGKLERLSRVEFQREFAGELNSSQVYQQVKPVDYLGAQDLLGLAFCYESSWSSAITWVSIPPATKLVDAKQVFVSFIGDRGRIVYTSLHDWLLRASSPRGYPVLRFEAV